MSVYLFVVVCIALFGLALWGSGVALGLRVCSATRPIRVWKLFR